MLPTTFWRNMAEPETSIEIVQVIKTLGYVGLGFKWGGKNCPVIWGLLKKKHVNTDLYYPPHLYRGTSCLFNQKSLMSETKRGTKWEYNNNTDRIDVFYIYLYIWVIFSW